MSRGPARRVTTVALAAVVTLVVLTVTIAPVAQGATVTVRVDSSSAAEPLFAGTVSTFPHPVDGGDGSGSHPCSGPSGSPSASATGALDDAMRAAGIAWRGNWDPSFRDFFIDRIGPYASSPPDSYWSLTVDGRFSSGGCLAPVADGDSVRLHFGPLFGAPPASEGGSAGTQTGPSAGDGVATHGESIGPLRLRRVGKAAAGFLRRSDGAGAEWATLALAVRGQAGVAAAAAGLLGPSLGAQRRDGSIGGDVNATAIAVLALSRSHPPKARAAARWLARAQSGAGGFGYRVGGVPADVDTSGVVAWALALEGRAAAARRAGAFIAAAQNPDGGFPTLPGGDSNSQSTGLALVGLRVSVGRGSAAAGDAGRAALGYLSSLASPGGSIAYAAHGVSPTPVWSTAQALLGLTKKGKLLLKYAPSTRLPWRQRP